MASRLFILTCLLIFGCIPKLANGDQGFHIYAPSRSTQSLWVVTATPSDGKLEMAVREKIELGFPAGTIVADAVKRRLYVASPRPSKGEQGRGAVISLADSGAYQSHKTVAFAHGYSYLSLDRRRRFLLGAFYFGGQVDVYSLDSDGVPAAPVSQLDEGRRNAHCVLTSPDNAFLYIPYVKDANALLQYRFNQNTGELSALTPKNAKPPEGTGPRHMAYHPSLPIAYFSNEQHIGVSVYERLDSGQLKVRQICDALEPGASKQGISSSDILITPDGRFVFAGIRGHQRDFDWISRYRVKSDGRLELLGLTAADKIPWGLTLSPDSRYLLATAFQGGTITAYRIGAEGQLRKAGSLACDKQITDLVTLAP